MTSNGKLLHETQHMLNNYGMNIVHKTPKLRGGEGSGDEDDQNPEGSYAEKYNHCKLIKFISKVPWAVYPNG